MFSAERGIAFRNSVAINNQMKAQSEPRNEVKSLLYNLHPLARLIGEEEKRLGTDYRYLCYDPRIAKHPRT